MPITITIAAQDASELSVHVRQLSETFGFAQRDPAGIPAIEPEKKAKKSSKAATAVVQTAPVELPVAPTPEPVVEENIFDAPPVGATIVLTFDDANKALHAVNEAKGMQVARKLLQDFGAARISAVKEADYARFIETANTLIKG